MSKPLFALRQPVVTGTERGVIMARTYTVPISYDIMRADRSFSRNIEETFIAPDKTGQPPLFNFGAYLDIDGNVIPQAA